MDLKKHLATRKANSLEKANTGCTFINLPLPLLWYWPGSCCRRKWPGFGASELHGKIFLVKSRVKSSF